MSERKVLNKYYPPDFDPTKIPKIKRPKNYKRGVFSIRLMAPFNMRCNTCGEYIYKGKKFNSRKETVENENYLGLHIFRFYIKCPRCIAEIAFKTDPETTDYVLEAGATRNFEATRTAEKMALAEQKEKEADEANNPMKVLENRTKASCQEMEMLETLEELRELRHRHATVDPQLMILQTQDDAKRLLQQQEDEDEQFVRSVFDKDGCGVTVKRLNSDSEDECSEQRPSKLSRPTDILTQGVATTSSSSSSSSKSRLLGLVKPKTTANDVTRTVTSSCARTTTDDVTRTTATSSCVKTTTDDVTRTTATSSCALLGLGAYSDTDSSNSD